MPTFVIYTARRSPSPARRLLSVLKAMMMTAPARGQHISMHLTGPTPTAMASLIRATTAPAYSIRTRKTPTRTASATPATDSSTTSMRSAVSTSPAIWLAYWNRMTTSCATTRGSYSIQLRLRSRWISLGYCQTIRQRHST